MALSSKPVFVIVPGASQTPAHYGYLQHLLLSQGYGVTSAVLPSVGNTESITAEVDAEYVRSRMLLPVLDVEKHDVILVSHSYSSVPASAAAKGLGKADRAAEGKSTSILAQIFISALLPRGGDGKDIVATFGGQLPPHIRDDKPANLLRCDDAKPPLYQDVPSPLAEAAVMSAFSQGRVSFMSPCPTATWDAEAFKGRCAFIRTLKDQAIPLEVQDMILQGTGQEWITRDIDTGHSPQLAAPEKLSSIILELAEYFEAL